MKSTIWQQRQKRDIYVKKAKNVGYLSRSAFKLIEIENKYNLLSKPNKILELGSAPGSWSQVICNFNNKTLIHAFDLLNMKFKIYPESANSLDFGKTGKTYTGFFGPDFIGNFNFNENYIKVILCDEKVSNWGGDGLLDKIIYH